MAGNPIDNSVNRAQPVNWWIMNYYPTNADGQVASQVGTLFSTKSEAIIAGRAALLAAGVGMVFVQQVSGEAIFNLYQPEPS